MASLSEQTQNALDEGRTLILGAQVLVGALYRTGFEPGFDQFPNSSKAVTVIALGIVLIAITLLIAPAPYHRIAEEGQDEPSFNDFVLQIMKFALLPFAFSLGMTIYVATAKVLNVAVGIALGVASTALAIFFWYALELLPQHLKSASRALDEFIPEPEQSDPRNTDGKRKENRMSEHKQEDTQEDKQKELDYQVRHVLTEARMVLPGAQALLGFQFVTFVLTDFDKLPQSSRLVHLASLVLMGISTVLLMTPAAFHRLAEHGRNTESFTRFAGKVLIAALVPLALGMCGDLFVVLRKTTHSSVIGIAVTAAILALSFALWFAYPMYRRGAAA